MALVAAAAAIVCVCFYTDICSANAVRCTQSYPDNLCRVGFESAASRASIVTVEHHPEFVVRVGS